MSLNHHTAKFQPPNFPWIPLMERDTRAIITYYYGDSNSEIIPIRDISHRYDPKVEPNFETMTYGLFSTCNPSVRKSICTNGIKLNFFCTRREETRVLTGYFEYGWFYEHKKNDFMLAAKTARFVSPGFPLEELNNYTKDNDIGKWFRCWKYVNSITSQKLINLINSTPNALEDYIVEVRNQEIATLEKFGKLYHQRQEGYMWKHAEQLFT